MSDWLESAELPLFGFVSVVMPASLLQSPLDHVQLLCSHVRNNSRVKLLFCLIFLANLHIQAIFCLLSLFAIPFCQGTVLFFASGLRTNLSFYNYFMFYTCLYIIPPLVSVLKRYISLQIKRLVFTEEESLRFPSLSLPSEGKKTQLNGLDVFSSAADLWGSWRKNECSLFRPCVLRHCWAKSSKLYSSWMNQWL